MIYILNFFAFSDQWYWFSWSWCKSISDRAHWRSSLPRTYTRRVSTYSSRSSTGWSSECFSLFCSLGLSLRWCSSLIYGMPDHQPFYSRTCVISNDIFATNRWFLKELFKFSEVWLLNMYDNVWGNKKFGTVTFCTIWLHLGKTIFDSILLNKCPLLKNWCAKVKLPQAVQLL